MIQSKELNSIGNDETLKIRKPYTITKQREKWMEEEHQKFLEALKLYGRGWRQIEEHVGTKTAIQIRSHAQKFFSKVVRESSSCTEIIKPIEIPPPRPKRKPMHPYPRKPAGTLKGTSVAIQLERSMSLSLVVAEKESQSPSLAVAEKESQSPTSVLNGVTSDAFGSEVSEQPGRCLSLNSCSTDVHSLSLSPVVKENEHMTLNTGDKGRFLSLQLSPSLVQENQFSLKFDSGSKDTICAEGDAPKGAPFTSFKLFGRTVLATDSQKPSPPCMDKNSNTNSSSYSSEHSIGVDNEKIICCTQLNTHLSSEMADSHLDSQPCGAPASSCMEHQKENSASSDSLLPQWILYQGLPFLYLPSFDQTSVQEPLHFEVRTGVDIQKERSCTDSNNCSVSEGGNGEKSLDAVDSQREQPCLEGRGSPRKCRKGFVPYKRCLEERDAESPMLASEEREGQRARVCS